MSLQPYYQDAAVTIYHGDCRAIAGELPVADAIVADPPYGETNLSWDVWPSGWPAALSKLSRQLWVFGSLRMFFAQLPEFSDWTFSQDVVWEKQNGSGLHSDRFRRVHENVVHFYRGPWGTLHKCPPTTGDARKRIIRRSRKPGHWKGISEVVFESEEGGPRIMRSVLPIRNCHGYAVHPTQKPTDIVAPLIEYSVPAGGLVLAPFMGSGTDLEVAKRLGRRAIGIEIDERFCEIAASRLSQEVLAL